MRIGIDTASYSDKPTGIGRYAYELCYHLNNYKDIEVVLFVNQDSPLLTDKHFKDNEKVIVKYPKLDLRRLYSLGKQIDQSNLDLFHVTAYNIPFIKKTPYVVTIHDLIHLKFPEIYGIVYKTYYQTIVKSGLLKAKRVITISENSKNDIKEWLNKDNISITPLAANKDFVPHLGISDLFYKYNIDKNNFILYVGNNRPNKNLKRLLMAYAKVTEEYEDFPSLILSCNADNELSELCENLFISEKVVFADNINEEELVILYSYAMYLVFPSLYEGFGLPLVEAMSTGCPVTCSNLSSIPEVIENNCLYFDPYNIKEISQALEQMYLDEGLRNKLSQQGLIRAKDFSWEKTAYQTYQIYQQCV